MKYAEFEPVVETALAVLQEHFGSCVILFPKSQRKVWQVELGNFYKCKYMISQAFEEKAVTLRRLPPDALPPESKDGPVP